MADMTNKLLNNNTFEQLFFDKYYNMTVREASILLDMTERYICDYLKSHMDYISVNQSQTYIFFPDNLQEITEDHIKVMEKAITILYADKDANDNNDRFTSINKYYEQLARKRFFIHRPNFRQLLIRDLRIVTVNPITNEEEYKKINRRYIDKLLQGTAKLYSLKTLKQQWGYRHNMQVYRQLNKLLYVQKSVIKVALVSNSTERPMVRYLFNIE